MHLYNRKNSFVFALLLGALFGAALLLYLPGVNGGFLFDDIPNLSRLSEYGPLNGWFDIWVYAGGQEIGLGRPVSFLSFLLDDTAWPTDAERFKRTNILLHLLNGLLLLLFICIIENQQKNVLSTERLLLIFFVLGVWLLNPFHVSTVLYVVQRMAMLSAMFMLLGMVLYIKGRFLLVDHRISAYALFFTAYFSGAVLGVFSKENAIIFPFMLILAEWLLLRNYLKVTALSKAEYLIWLLFPATVAVIGLATRIPEFLMVYEENRDFSLIERLLTQQRVVFDYLMKFIVPGVKYQNLYSEARDISTGLFTPISTFLTMAFNGGLIFVAWRLRNKIPLITFTILFFYVGNIVESSFIPLEIEYEHRGYFPLMMASLAGLSLQKEQFCQRRRVIAIALYLLVLACMLSVRVSFWSDTESLKRIWQVESPGGERAATSVASDLFQKGRFVEALDALEEGRKDGSYYFSVAVNKLVVKCKLGIDTEDDITDVYNSLTQKKYLGSFVSQILGNLVLAVRESFCNNLEYDDVLRISQAVEARMELGDADLARVYLNRADIYLVMGKYEEFVESVFKSAELDTNKKAILVYASKMAAWGQLDQSIRLLRENETVFNSPEGIRERTTGYGSFLFYKEQYQQLLKLLNEEQSKSEGLKKENAN